MLSERARERERVGELKRDVNDACLSLHVNAQHLRLATFFACLRFARPFVAASRR